MVVRGLGDQRGEPCHAQPGQGIRVCVAFEDGQVGGAEPAGQRAHGQQLAGQVLNPALVVGAGLSEPVCGAHPAVQRGPLGAGQDQRAQPGRVEQGQPGQGVGVNPVALGMPGQEPAQVGCLLRRHTEHAVPAGGKEHRDRQPCRPVGSITTSSRVPAGQSASATVSTAVRLSAVGQALRLATTLPSPSSTRTVWAVAMPRSMPTSLLWSIPPPRVAYRHAPARPLGAAPSGHGPKQPRPAAAPTHVLQPGQASKGRPTSLIRGIRGQARSGNQNYGARHAGPPQSGSRRHPPDQPGMTMQPLGTSAL